LDGLCRALSASQGEIDPFPGQDIRKTAGIAHQQMQNFGASRRAYREAMKINKEFAEAWNNMGTRTTLSSVRRSRSSGIVMLSS
jgi:hypothetical protein